MNIIGKLYGLQVDEERINYQVTHGSRQAQVTVYSH